MPQQFNPPPMDFPPWRGITPMGPLGGNPPIGPPGWTPTNQYLGGGAAPEVVSFTGTISGTLTATANALLGSQTGSWLIEAMQPWMTTALGWFLDGAGSMFDQVTGLAYDFGVDGDPDFVPGYGALLDPLLCPAADLPYLGQFVGVAVPVGQDAATALSLVTAEAGQNRGTLAAIAAAVQRSLSTPWAPDTSYTAGVMFTVGKPVVYYLVSTTYTSGAAFGATDLANTAIVDPTTQYSIVERLNPSGLADAYWITINLNPNQLSPANNTAALLSAVNAVKPGGVMLNVPAVESPAWDAATLAWDAVAGTVTWASVEPGQV